MEVPVLRMAILLDLQNVEIEDKQTGCTYIKKGLDVIDCINQF
jgi:hypothetical protein